jgi:pimeloyl-ACP methyl ester carboxylesterase
MPKIVLACVLALLVFVSPCPSDAQDCTSSKVDVGGYGLWVEHEGTGAATIVFEAGGGDDSSVWSAITPQIRAMGYATLVYDRAGLGKSEPRPGTYSVERDVHDFRAVLDACKVEAPVYVVSHSYGGFITMLASVQDRRIAGLVLVDANIPDYFIPKRIDAILAQYRPQYAELRSKAPSLAAAMIPMMEAYPSTVKTLRHTHLRPGLPIVDIVAENSWATSPEDAIAMRNAHKTFVQSGAGRKAVVATGSSHRVMKDRPDLIIQTVRDVTASH